MGRRSERLSKQGMLASDLSGEGDVIQVVSRAFDVLRCFEDGDITHVEGKIAPLADIVQAPMPMLPGPHLDGKSLYELFESEQVTFSAGVPTVWLGLLEEFKKRGRKPKALKQILGGGDKVESLPPDVLKPFLPETLGGLARASVSASTGPPVLRT